MNNSIYIALQNILKANEPAKFFNTFRGMPVNYSGNIIKINGARVSFRVSKLQINCMALNHGTFIKTNRLTGVLRAKLADYDLFQPCSYWHWMKFFFRVRLKKERAFPTKKIALAVRLNLPSFYDAPIILKSIWIGEYLHLRKSVDNLPAHPPDMLFGVFPKPDRSTL